MFLFSFGAQLSLSLVLISHITYFGAQMSYISVLISHIANFGAQLSLLLVLISHIFTLVLNYLFSWCSKHTSSHRFFAYYVTSRIRTDMIEETRVDAFLAWSNLRVRITVLLLNYVQLYHVRSLGNIYC